MNKPAAYHADVNDCPRCGRDHDDLLHHLFHRPIAPPELDFAWEYWSTCPVTGDPILTAVTQ